MDIEQARQTVAENRARQPSPYDKQFEQLFIHPHFADVITEVYPQVLDPNDKYGMYLMESYSSIATFLEKTKETDKGVLVTVRIHTEPIGFDMEHPPQGVRALSVRYYSGLRADHFQITRDDTGAPRGIMINHPSLTSKRGWDTPDFQGIEPEALFESNNHDISLFKETHREVDGDLYTIFGTTDEFRKIVHEVQEIEQRLRIMTHLISGVLTDMESDALRIRAGMEPVDFRLQENK